ncbi:MAG: DUF4340 domain-containing protein [Rhodospirillaceae bacterium]|mgnify:FL=1|jgi:hypothetical protein|nr:DUF4340 domain-containing protein [Rhodospirillaceae bacterium]MBT4938379.1 DUF4340 domain-containing protein [Rhodospirillaceae bacterium]MBT5939328.1 DUF4340 domain-containing protein [Rhodospirillaceae bacterium]MBT7265505.1 DUF4340 domain-containing protein [Rhodospirillaceae bacterium]
MNPKAFIGFTAVTAIVVVAAGFSITSRYSVHKVGLQDKPVLPGFADKASTVSEIIVQDAKKTITVKRQGDKWVMADRQNYVASNEVLSDMLLGLSELRLREAKTKKPNLYERLQVEDLKGKKAKSILLTVKSKSGELAKLILGKVNADVVGPSNVGRYIRKPGEAQSWLASGRLDVPGDINKWVKPEFLHVASKRVSNVKVRQADGSEMIVSRAGKEKFKIDNMPEKLVVEYQSDIDNMGDGLDKLELEDVKAAGQIKFPADKTLTTEIKTNDGLIVDVKMVDVDDGHFWAALSAKTADTASAAVKKEAAALNAKLSKWVYELPAHKYRYMSRKFSDVLKDPSKDKKKK